MKSSEHRVLMQDWLMKDQDEEHGSKIKRIVNVNQSAHVDEAMKRLLQKSLNINELQVQTWIENYRRGKKGQFYASKYTMHIHLKMRIC